MEKFNTLIYRAKKLGSDEYVIGYYFYYHYYKRHSIKKEIEDVNGTSNYDIDPSTLAIHFPDMLDSENNPIFASLSNDGKGGDRIDFRTIEMYESGRRIMIPILFNRNICLFYEWENTLQIENEKKWNDFGYRKVIGIQE